MNIKQEEINIFVSIFNISADTFRTLKLTTHFCLNLGMSMNELC